MRLTTTAALLTMVIVLGSACGGGGGTNPPPPPPPPGGVGIAKAPNSGDAQSAPLGTQLANPLRVLVTQGPAPVAGRQVLWTVSPEGGSALPATAVTGQDGIAVANITLPGIGTTVTISAASSGATGSPVEFTAEATGASTQVTVRVGNSFFSPQFFRIKQGGTVTFTWVTGAAGHSVQPVAPNTIPASSNPPPPGLHNAPHTFDVTFLATGVFKYHCSAHGAPDSGMHGTITVVP